MSITITTTIVVTRRLRRIRLITASLVFFTAVLLTIAGVGLELLIDDMTFFGSCSVLVVTPACSLTWLFVVGCGRGDEGTDTKAPLRIMVVGC